MVRKLIISFIIAVILAFSTYYFAFAKTELPKSSVISEPERISENFIRYEKHEDKVYALYMIVVDTGNASSAKMELREVMY